MPRYARIHVTGGLFHIISRFHNRQFYLDINGAREKYLELLGKSVEAHDCRVVAYCLMSSHVHLVVQLGNDPLGSFPTIIPSPFGTWLNTQKKGLGTIFADRPKSVLVHRETRGMELIRYVHNNPVRAGVVEWAKDSSWSSHRAYMGLEPCPPWLATEAVLGPDEEEHKAVRRDLALYVDDGRTEERRPEFSGEVSKALARRIRKLMGGDIELSYPVLGPDEFVVEVLKKQAKRQRERKKIQTSEVGVSRIVKGVFESLGLDPKLARKRIKPKEVAHGRALVAWLWVEKMGRQQVTVAEGLNVRPATVTKMLTKLRKEGIKQRDKKILNPVLKSLNDDTGVKKNGKKKAKAKEKQPKVLVLKRKRG